MQQPRPRPNYALRRAGALVVALVLVGGVVGLVAAVASRFGTASPPPATGAPTTTVRTSPGPASTPPASELPACHRGDVETFDDDQDDWATTLLDTTYRLPKDYVPDGLVSVDRAGFTGSPLLIRGLVVTDLAALRDAAEDAGHPIDLEAAYRSYADQASLLARRERSLGRAAALERVASPGHSEHQLGTTIDIRSQGALDVDQDWDDDPTGAWVEANAWRFGFTQSYPKGEEAVTCYAFEPWHYRYLGRTMAAQVHASGLTLREFLWKRHVDGTEPR